MYANSLNFVSSASFLPDTNQVMSRDYLSIKKWDLRMNRHIYSANTADNLERNMGKLQQSGALDDEFFLSVS
jgi:hypothetical protein